MRQFALLWLTIVAAHCTPLFAEEFKGPIAAIEPKDGDTIVFLGDSITQQCLYTQYVENYFTRVCRTFGCDFTTPV